MTARAAGVRHQPDRDRLTLRIVLEAPPTGVDFGIHQGRGSIYETIAKQRSAGGDLSFEFEVDVKSGPREPTDFGGPIVQGPRNARFVYVDIGACAGQHDTTWSRRLKIPLAAITADLIRRATSGANRVLEVRVSGTGRDGGPSCGTAKDVDHWTPGR